jgi:hypothetical protein
MGWRRTLVVEKAAHVITRVLRQAELAVTELVSDTPSMQVSDPFPPRTRISSVASFATESLSNTGRERGRSERVQFALVTPQSATCGVIPGR